MESLGLQGTELKTAMLHKQTQGIIVPALGATLESFSRKSRESLVMEFCLFKPTTFYSLEMGGLLLAGSSCWVTVLASGIRAEPRFDLPGLSCPQNAWLQPGKE